MKLNSETLKNRAEWEAKGYLLPAYDRDAVVERTKENPTWLHFGAGNIFKALHGMAAQRLLNEGKLDRGIIAVERMDRGGDTAIFTAARTACGRFSATPLCSW